MDIKNTELPTLPMQIGYIVKCPNDKYDFSAYDSDSHSHCADSRFRFDTPQQYRDYLNQQKGTVRVFQEENWNYSATIERAHTQLHRELLILTKK